MNGFEITVGKIIIWGTVISLGISVLSIIGMIIYTKIDDWRFNKWLKK